MVRLMPTTTPRARRLRLALAAMTAAVAPAGCSSAPPPGPAPAPLHLVASVAQFRFDEGTRNLKAGVTNDSDRDIRVSQATIAWDGFAFPTVPVAGGDVQPGQTAAFTIAYGAPRCSAPPRGKPLLVAVVDGRTLRLPLRVEDPGLLLRLHAKACAAERLDAAATVRLRLARTTTRIGGVEYLPGQVVLTHRPGATDRVRLVDLGGSVLLDLLPRGGRAALPGVLAGERRTLAFPVLLGSAHRCDAHALGQSSQTFLISAYVRLDAQPTQRVILPLSTAEKDRLVGVVHRDCS
jgi:hypothetical protein